MTEGSDSAITAFRLASRLLPGIVLLVTIVAAILSLVEYDDYKTLLFDAFAALHIIGGVFGLASVFILPEYPISVPNEHANKKRAYKVVTALVNVVFVVVGIAVLIVRSANEANGAFVADLERSWTIYAYVGLVLDLIGILVLVAVNCGRKYLNYIVQYALKYLFSCAMP